MRGNTADAAEQVIEAAKVNVILAYYWPAVTKHLNTVASFFEKLPRYDKATVSGFNCCLCGVRYPGHAVMVHH